MANSHYVARFLTERWENSGQTLTFFDFNEGRFDKVSSKNLYAKHGLFSADLEDLLNNKCEKIAANEIDAIVNGKADYTNFRKYRALIFLILLQGSRTSVKKNAERNLEGLIKLSDE
jgi:hypothetical protein